MARPIIVRVGGVPDVWEDSDTGYGYLTGLSQWGYADAHATYTGVRTVCGQWLDDDYPRDWNGCSRWYMPIGWGWKVGTVKKARIQIYIYAVSSILCPSWNLEMAAVSPGDFSSNDAAYDQAISAGTTTVVGSDTWLQANLGTWVTINLNAAWVDANWGDWGNEVIYLRTDLDRTATAPLNLGERQWVVPVSLASGPRFQVVWG